MSKLAVAVMQPYFFPYIGYFQLINSVDLFVSFDDVNFIKKGWIHRNRILLNGVDHQISLPIQKMSQNKKINESFIFEAKKEKKALVNLIIDAYKKKAPYFDENFEVIRDLILSDEENIAIYNTSNLKNLSRYLGIATKFVYSSEVAQDVALTGQDKIINLVKHFKGDTYVNASGGKDLYDKGMFSAANIDLRFVPSRPLCYSQGASEFVSNLSVIDVLMYAGKAKLIEVLKVEPERA